MPWSTTRDVRAFVQASGEFLESRPVEHSILLTETAYLQAVDATSADQLFGWYDDGGVAGAFVQAPRHPAVVSPLSSEAFGSLPEVLPDLTAIGVDARDIAVAGKTWRRSGTALEPQSLIDVHRLRRLRPTPMPDGEARTATAADRDLLVAWFEQLMADFPDDPSDRAYVVDDPLSYGGITVWEKDGRPVAMAGRSRLVAGMVRLSAVYAVEPGYDNAAFVAACEAAADIADDVLVFASAEDPTSGQYARLGFEPAGRRCLMTSTT